MTSFDGSLIDIYGINQKKLATSLNKVQSLDTCSPIYCIYVMERQGFLLAGQIEGFVDVIETKDYEPLY